MTDQSTSAPPGGGDAGTDDLTSARDAVQVSTRPDSLATAVRAWWVRVRAGELGNLPIVIGLLAITVIFTALNERFLSSVNFVNLIVQTAPLAVIAMGVTFVLIIAEVDLSVGYLSGVASVVLARLLGEQGLPVLLAMVIVLAVGALAGLVQGYLVAKVGLPSLIVTLGGLVGFNGLVLILIGGRGTIVIQDDVIIAITNRYLPLVLSITFVLVGAAAYAAVMLGRRQRRRAVGLDPDPVSLGVLRLLLVLVVGLGAVFYAAGSRGVPYVAVLLGVLLVILTIVLTRTRFGRHVFAVGGNPEAARRAGIELVRVRIACFMISGTMAALGGIVFASRLRSVDTGAGGGQIELNAIAAAVIGGTSLFGGRGAVSSALFGAFVIMGVDNGMGLLGLSSGAKFVVTAAVLLAAVLVDSIARRGQRRSGLA